MFENEIELKDILNPYITNEEMIRYYYNLYLNEKDDKKKCALLIKIQNLLKIEEVKDA